MFNATLILLEVKTELYKFYRKKEVSYRTLVHDTNMDVVMIQTLYFKIFDVACILCC